MTMRRAIFTAIVAIALVMLILPFAVGICALRVDSFYDLKGSEVEAAHGPLVISFRAIRCLDGGQKASLPGALGPNETANGFQIGWDLKGNPTSVIDVKDIKAVLVKGTEIQALDVPFSYWAGEFSASKNCYYAFVSTGGYPSELPLGVYHIRLSYTVNGIAYHDEVTLEYAVARKLGFHAPFYSVYF